MREACLVVMYGESIGRRISLTAAPLCIGRSAESDLQLEDWYDLYQTLTPDQRREADTWTARGEKLGGWPAHDEAWTACPECREPTTQHVLSIGGRLDPRWGGGLDDDVLIITSCATHPRRLAWRVVG